MCRVSFLHEGTMAQSLHKHLGPRTNAMQFYVALSRAVSHLTSEIGSGFGSKDQNCRDSLVALCSIHHVYSFFTMQVKLFLRKSRETPSKFAVTSETWKATGKLGFFSFLSEVPSA